MCELYHFIISCKCRQLPWLPATSNPTTGMAEYGHEMSLDAHTQTNKDTCWEVSVHPSHQVCVRVWQWKKVNAPSLALIVSEKLCSCYMIRCGGWSLSVSPSACCCDDRNWALPLLVSGQATSVSCQSSVCVCVCVCLFYGGNSWVALAVCPLGSAFPLWPADPPPPHTHTHTNSHAHACLHSRARCTPLAKTSILEVHFIKYAWV